MPYEDELPHVQNQPRDSVEVLIEHANRMWLAECENASRIAQRSQVVAGGIIALFGLGLYSIDWLYETPSSQMVHWALVLFMHLLLLGTLGCFVKALAVLFLEHDGRPGTASEELEILENDTGKPIRRLVLNKTNAAYFELKDRNAAAWLRLKRSQEWFSWGFGLVLITILCYLVGSLPTKMFPEDGRDEHNDNRTQAVESHEAGRTGAGDRSSQQGEPNPGGTGSE